MQRKIFIVIDIDEKAKNFINKKIEKLKDELSFRWVDKENYHITLSFLGYLEDNDLVDLGMRIAKKLKDNQIFDIHLNKIVLAPDRENPKMIWLIGEKNQKLIDLRHKIEQISIDFESERKEFKPHINLGKLKGSKAKEEALKKANEIERVVNLLIPVTGVKILESKIEKRKQQYYMIDSMEFN